jgi:hypothetical protein
VCLLCDSTVEAARLAQRGHGFRVSDPLGCVHLGQILINGCGVLREMCVVRSVRDVCGVR